MVVLSLVNKGTDIRQFVWCDESSRRHQFLSVTFWVVVDTQVDLVGECSLSLVFLVL